MRHINISLFKYTNSSYWIDASGCKQTKHKCKEIQLNFPSNVKMLVCKLKSKKQYRIIVYEVDSLQVLKQALATHYK